MKKSYLCKMTILSVLLVSVLVIAGCGSGGGGSAVFAPVYAFSDNFDSYGIADPWVPAGGWTSSQHWAIVAGFSGNGVEYMDTNAGFLTSSYTGTDYTVSVWVCPTAIVTGWEFGIFARDDGSGNRYSVVLNDDTTSHITTIGISKFYNNGVNNGKPVIETFINSDLSISTYYTLTLTVSGAVITVSATGGGNSHITTWTDPGTPTFGAIIPSGKAGILVYTGPTYPVIYDNFAVTEP